jgi:acyltransferase-like protein
MNGVETATIVPTSSARVAKSQPGNRSAGGYNVAFGYLRAFITLLVLAHHAVLAYHPYAPAPSAKFNIQPLMWTAFPIVDSQRWRGIELFVGFNDIFFMSLMFFLSGLFVWPSLVRKGTGRFVHDRLLRLGLPFLVASGLLAPLAYYPAYRVTGADPGLAAFGKQWLSLGTWPSGPAWFIWVLLAFDCVAAALSKMAPRWGEALGRLGANAQRRPVIFFGLLLAVSAAAYIPMALTFDPLRWISFGPFSFQLSRIMHYAVYFSSGVGVGAYGIERGLLASNGRLARRWPIWLLVALGAYVLAIVTFTAFLSAMFHGTTGIGWRTLLGLTFVLSCAASGFAFLAIFLRFARARVRLFDSLSNNAYGIYLVHYAFVIWLQFALLSTVLPGAAKGSIVFFGTLALSWGTTMVIRRIPAVARVL